MIVLVTLGALGLLALAVWIGYTWGFESRGADSLSSIVDVLEDMHREQCNQSSYLYRIAQNTESLSRYRG